MVLLATFLVAGCEKGSSPETGRLERITLGPREARRPVGEVQHFTATGHYARGTTRNLTQKLEYASSDPAIRPLVNAVVMSTPCTDSEASPAGGVLVTSTW